MSFQLAQIALKENTTSSTAIKIAIAGPRAGSKRSTYNAKIILSGLFCKEMGIRAGDKFNLLVGVGPDAGKIQLQKNNSNGQTSARERGNGRGIPFMAILLGQQHVFAREIRKAVCCEWRRVDPATWEIVIPENLQARLRPAHPATPPARQEFPTPRGSSITASVMGDPDPNRHENAERLRRQLDKDFKD